MSSSQFDVKLPDVGEGVAEAEIVSWHVAVGDRVAAEAVLAEVMTDKATIEVASPVSGVVTTLHGEPGDVLAVGGPLVTIALDGDAPVPLPASEAPSRPASDAPSQPAGVATLAAGAEPTATPTVTGRALAAPAVRARARALGVDLAMVAGSGPDGRVLHADVDRHLVAAGAMHRAPSGGSPDGTRVEPVRGLRRRIAQRLTESWREIPHITYVDAVDVTELEVLRAELNRRAAGSERLTLLPFIVRALVVACGEQPRLNATYDAGAELLTLRDAVHVGIATQTPDGLVVPVLRHAESLPLRAAAVEIARLAAAARDGRATRDELGGSTITITSLGALGGLVTTPLINPPEVAVIGVNKVETRPVWREGAFVPRQMMNLSSSFDHRIVDGWDAATFVQRIKGLLEVPALLFVDG